MEIHNRNSFVICDAIIWKNTGWQGAEMRKKGKYNKKRKLNRVVKVILLAVGIILVALLIQTEILATVYKGNIIKN